MPLFLLSQISCFPARSYAGLITKLFKPVIKSLTIKVFALTFISILSEFYLRQFLAIKIFFKLFSNVRFFVLIFPIKWLQELVNKWLRISQMISLVNRLSISPMLSQSTIERLSQ